MNKWEIAKEVITIIEEHTYEAYVVGGCVRDQFLNRSVKDIDITTSALPEAVISMFTHVIPTGIQHGTVLVLFKGESFEVTTFRNEGTYTDKRHPDYVTFIPDIEGDLARRDFTINALAMDRHGKLIDLFNGRNDLSRKIIKTVGNAKERFTEDALRILRALRFSSQLGFSIDHETLQQMIVLKEEIKFVAIERIKEECQKFFEGTHLSHGIRLLRETNIATVLPIFSHHPQLMEHTPDDLSSFTSFSEVITYYHLIDSTISIQSWVKAWKCSNKEKNIAIKLVNCIRYYEENGIDYWLAYILEVNMVDTFIHLFSLLYKEEDHVLIEKSLTEKQHSLPIHKPGEIEINGHDIMSLFPAYKKGSWIRGLLESIEYLIVMGTLENNNTVIKEWIKCHPPDKS